MSQKKQRDKRRRQRALALFPTAKADAAFDIQIALQIRNEANATGRCICGATAQITTAAPGVHVATFNHEDHCPAISPLLDEALARGEIHDPAGDLFASLGT